MVEHGDAHSEHASVAYLDNVRAICCRHEVKRESVLLWELELLLRHLVVHIDLVGDTDAWNALAVCSQLPAESVSVATARYQSMSAHNGPIPLCHILICAFARDVKRQDAAVRTVIVRRVHRREPLLPSCVPDVCAGLERVSAIGLAVGAASKRRRTNFDGFPIHLFAVSIKRQSIRRPLVRTTMGMSA